MKFAAEAETLKKTIESGGYEFGEMRFAHAVNGEIPWMSLYPKPPRPGRIKIEFDQPPEWIGTLLAAVAEAMKPEILRVPAKAPEKKDIPPNGKKLQ